MAMAFAMLAVEARYQESGRSGRGGKPSAPRLTPVGAVLLRLKAETVLGVLLVVRHRTVRLVYLFAVVVLGMALVRGGAGGQHPQAVLVAVGSLAAVAGSRLLAHGAPLAAVRWTAGPWWLAPTGRLVGAWLTVVPVAAVGSGILVGGAGDWSAIVRLIVIAGLYAAAVLALAMCLAPPWGASVAGTVGLLVAWLGGIPPSGMLAILAPWPYAQRPVVALWNVLPLDWRAGRWFDSGVLGDPAVLAAWVVIGVVLAAWGAARATPSGSPPQIA